MSPVIDFHVHSFPDHFRAILNKSDLLSQYVPQQKIGLLRRQMRSWLSPFSRFVHRTQVFMRNVPEKPRKAIDELAVITSASRLLIESTPSDLIEAMDLAGVDSAVVIAHPPFSSNEFVLDACAENPRLIPAMNIPPGTPAPGKKLRSYFDKGAKVLKLHLVADGEGTDSLRYKALLTAASDLGMPVIIHTGCIHSRLAYKDPEKGKAELYVPWFEAYRQTKFILAHMNLHEPAVTFDLAETHPNILVDTSWQPAEVIAEAVRRIGAERVLFGTDWPLLGDNIALGIGRIRECVDAGIISGADAALILGKNAQSLLNTRKEEVITPHADPN